MGNSDVLNDNVRLIRLVHRLEQQRGKLLEALEEVRKKSHTDRCDWPHSKDARCTCHIAGVEQAMAIAKDKGEA